MIVYMHIVQIILAVALIIVVILQARGSDLGGVFGGGGGGVYRTRRGVEKTLFNATIALSILFFIVSVLTVIIQR